MVEQTQVQRIKSVLKQIRELKEEDEKAAQATGKNFNVFSVLGVERREVRHSAFLADLLNPKGSHQQGAVFLEHFLKLPPLLEKLPCLFFENFGEFQVTKEQYAPYSDDGHGLIDIFLKKRDACIIVENKIDKSLDPGQLNKYYTYARGYFEDRQIGLIYLTPDGKKPSKESLAGREPLDADRVICVSYESHIVEWLEDCLKKVVGIARLHEMLLQYQEIAEKPTGQLINKELTMKISDVLIKDYYLITELENSITEAKRHIRGKFWKKLEKKMGVCAVERCDDKEMERNFKVSRCERLPCFEIVVRVKLYSLAVWYGFGLLENGSIVERCEEEKFEKYVALVRDVLKANGSDKNALGWKLLKYQGEAVSFSDFGTEQMRHIVEDDKMVDDIAQEIKNAVDRFKEAKEDAEL